MNSIAVSELRSNLMNVLKKIEHGSSIDITSRGKVVAKLVPPDYSRKRARNKLKEISEDAVIGNIVLPLDSRWKADQ